MGRRSQKSLTKKTVVPENQETRSETSLLNEKDLSQLMRKRSLSLLPFLRSNLQKNLKKKTRKLENKEIRSAMNLVREEVSSRPKRRKSSLSLQFYRENQRKNSPQKNLTKKRVIQENLETKSETSLLSG